MDWPRVIILVDMNAFFASVEQMDKPEWQGRPIAVTNGVQGTTIITSSYEARAWGIRTGMRLKQARILCPELIQAPARPERYAAISTHIMHALTQITPDVEVFSGDEALLEVTYCQKLLGTPENIARQVKKIVFKVSGILCSVGVSGDKTTAKYAAKLNKPDGLTIIPPWQAEAVLSTALVTDLCGVNKGIGRFLAERGVMYCGDMKNISPSVLGKRFGSPGQRIWLMAQGMDPTLVVTDIPAPKSMGHGKVIPPNTSDKTVLLTYCQHRSEKLARRLRKHQLQAQTFFIAVKSESDWIKTRSKTQIPMNDGRLIYGLCQRFLEDDWQARCGVFQVQVTALDPQPEGMQYDLFAISDEKKNSVNRVMDGVNTRYGEFTLSPARLLNRSQMPNVIAPAWKPDGHRQTI
jgi:DNA polymerase-4